VKINRNIRRERATGDAGERGYVLIVLLLLSALLLIGLAAAVPAIGTQIQRNREEELIHRGKQYTRAIKLFYRKFGRYPTSLKELQDTNHMRFLRQDYKDPMTASGNWRIIHFGEQSSTAVGLFGKPGSAFQTGPNPSPSPNPTTPTGTPGNPATPVAQIGTLQPGAATLGGGPIVGVASTSKKSSIRVLNKKTHYNDWEFVYDPTQDLASQLGAVAGQPGQPGVQPGAQSPTSPQAPGQSGTFGMPGPGAGPSPAPAPSPGPAPAPTTQQ
jgi:type II secretory pathway pseudopilin PulG